MSSNILTAADRLTFTKLFAERDGASFAKVLYESLTTAELVRLFNNANKTSLAICDTTGLVVVTDTRRGDFRTQVDLFMKFVWEDVFLTIQQRRAA